MELENALEIIKNNIKNNNEGLMLFTDTSDIEINLLSTKDGMLTFICSILSLIIKLEKTNDKSISDNINELHDIINQPYISAIEIYKNKNDFYKKLIELLKTNEDSLTALTNDPQFDIYKT